MATTVDVANFETAAETAKKTYLKQTHDLNNYNEIYTVNKYLQNMNQVEIDRLSRINENIKSKVLKMKQQYMLLDYGINENKMRTRILYATMIVTSIIFIVFAVFYQGKITQDLAIMVSLVLMVVYFGLVIFIIMANSKRRKYAWDQYYWQEMKKKS